MIPSETRKCEQGASEGSTELAVVLNKHDSMSTLGLLKGDEINDALRPCTCAILSRAY